MIELSGVSKTYRLGRTTVSALSDVSLRVRRGEFVAVAGPSGSGKSTLLNIIGCLDRPDSGAVLIDGEPVAGLSRNRLADLRIDKIGFIFQSFNLIPVLNVYENVEFPFFIKRSGLTAREKRARVLSLLDEVGLKEHAGHKPDELSGGQRQRVAIARALVTGPALVLADEPTANLDSKTGGAVIDIMKRLNEKECVTFVFATHDQAVTARATSLYRLADGSLAAEEPLA